MGRKGLGNRQEPLIGEHQDPTAVLEPESPRKGALSALPSPL